MKERPILFSGPMVRALLAGTKTQTRRVVKPQPAPDQQPRTVIGSSGFVYVMDNAPLLSYPEVRRVRWDCPYGQPGDRLWVRETWHDASSALHSCALYRADGGEIYGGKWAPSIHMPRWASRITLEITGVRVERLQDISEADARSEGCTQNHNGYFWGGPHQTGGMKQMATALQAYQDLWESINGPGSWDANPWVWVLEFRRINSKEIEHAQ